MCSTKQTTRSGNQCILNVSIHKQEEFLREGSMIDEGKVDLEAMVVSFCGGLCKVERRNNRRAPESDIEVFGLQSSFRAIG